MRKTIYSSLLGTLLTIRSATNTKINDPESAELFQAQPNDVFELTGNVIEVSNSSKSYRKVLLVEGELDVGDPTKFWIPLDIDSLGPNHLVATKKGDELGPLCYTDYYVYC